MARILMDDGVNAILIQDRIEKVCEKGKGQMGVCNAFPYNKRKRENNDEIMKHNKEMQLEPARQVVALSVGYTTGPKSKPRKSKPNSCVSSASVDSRPTQRHDPQLAAYKD